MCLAFALRRFLPAKSGFLSFILVVLIPWVTPVSGAAAGDLSAGSAESAQARPQVQRPPARPTPRMPAAVGKSQVLERVIQNSSKVRSYRFKIEQGPAGLEGEVDLGSKAMYLRIDPVRKGVPPAELWLRQGQAYGKHAYLNRWFKIKGMSGIPDHLGGVVALVQRDKNAVVREEAGALKLDIPMDIPGMSQKVGEQLGAWLRTSKARNREAFAQKVLSDLKDRKVTAQITVAKDSYLINRVVLQSQSTKGRRASMTISISPLATAVRALPAQALRARTEIPLGALFYRLHSIQGWCRATHRFFALESLNLIKAEDTAAGYSEIYNNGKLDIVNQEDKTFNPVIIGADYEDVEDGDDLATAHAIYVNWIENPAAYLQGGLVRDYRHFGGGGQGLERTWLFDLRDGDSTPDVGDRFYSARDWGYGAAAANRNGMSFREAISQYGKGTINGRKAAYLMIGHVVHLLQDQAMPDHAALVVHPGSSMTDEQLYEEIPLCDLLAAEMMVIGCGTTCPPLDLICYAVCAEIASSAAAAAKLACEEGIDPNEMGYEKVVLLYYPNYYAQANIGGRVAKTGSVRHPDYNGYFQEIAALSVAEPARRGLSQPLGLGMHPATAIVDYPVDPYIHGNSEAEKRPYLELTDAVAVPAITRSAGLMKHFYEIVNQPPYVSSISITQNGQQRFGVSWIPKTDGAGPRREVTRVSKPLYPGVEATLQINFGPVGLDGQNRKMAEVTVKMDGQAFPVTHQLNGMMHTYRGTFVPPCTGTQTKTVQISISGRDGAPHLSGRTPLGNELDRLPNTFARVANDPPYAFTGYEPGGSYNETFTISPTPACWKDVTEQSSCGRTLQYPYWRAIKGSSFTASLKIVEQGTETPPGAAASCGRYRLHIAPNIKFQGTTGWYQGPPSLFDLTLAINDPYSMNPKIEISHSKPSESLGDTEALTFRIPLILTYETPSGIGKELCRVDQELKLIGMGDVMKDFTACIVGKFREQAEWVGPWEEVEGMRDRGRPVDLFRAVHAGRLSDSQRGAAFLGRLQVMAGERVMFISRSGSSRRMSLQEAKLTITRTSDPRVVSVKASAQTALGKYIIPFSTGGKAGVETVIIVNVTK